METVKSTRKKSGKQDIESLIVDSYKKYLLLEGKQPASIYKFCIDIQVEEQVFYNHFGSFEAIDRFIWKDFAHKTQATLTSDASFSDLTAREKLLTFYFALAEVLKSNRSYALVCMKNPLKPELVPDYLKDFKKVVDQFIQNVVQEGLSKNEIASRPFLDKRYPHVFWVHMSVFLLYWKNDTSKAFESTDVFIEKSITLAFELIGKGALDTALDLIKFLYQSKMKF